MTELRLDRAEIDALEFDLYAEVAAFKASLEAHRLTEGQAAPVSYPIVERIVREGLAVVIVEPPPPALPTTLRMETFWARMTEPEAEAVDEAVNALSARLRRIFNGLQFLDLDLPDYTAIRAMVAGATTPARSDVILAPEF